MDHADGRTMAAGFYSGRDLRGYYEPCRHHVRPWRAIVEVEFGKTWHRYRSATFRREADASRWVSKTLHGLSTDPPGRKYVR